MEKRIEEFPRNPNSAYRGGRRPFLRQSRVGLVLSRFPSLKRVHLILASILPANNQSYSMYYYGVSRYYYCKSLLPHFYFLGRVW